ncbi:ABC transporter substrate-binding protein [Segeticoccus rhizosphaerae]|uniref:ABC transporter substrate-binding protein n=1 Tax=Segeticoccus rhizosphaerae TaxID=1104777 RepID=UPI0010C10A0E|nr:MULTISPECIES: ABC transporter substrate-binding protein [Intrasporangiaceae]
MRSPAHRGVRPIAATATASAVLALAGVPALASTASAVDEGGKHILKVAYSSTIDTFNPFVSIYLTPTGINRMVYENLVQYSAKDGSPIPGLAESWDTSKDGKTWTFHIRPGMKWSDGQPITSADPQWTYTQMMTNEAMSQANGSLVTNFAKVSAPDPDTLVITMKEGTAVNPGIEIPVVPKHVWSKLKNPAKFDNSKDVVGSGPYVLESYKPSQQVVLKPNPNFWRGKPKMDGVTYVNFKNGDAAVQGLKAGTIDLIGGLEVPQFDALKDAKGVTVNSGSGRRFTGLGLNPGATTKDGTPMGDGNPVLKDPVVRRAIRQAINIPALMDKMLQGHGTLATSFVPAVFPQWHWHPDKSKLATYEPDAANAALDQAGYKKGPDGIRLGKDGKPIVLRLLGDNSDSTDKQMADYIMPWLKKIGIKVDLQMSDGDAISVDLQKANYDMYFTGWSLGSDPDFQLGINTCSALPVKPNGEGGTSMDFWCDKKFDKLYEEQHAELDQGKREQIVQKMLAMHYNAAPSIDFWYGDSLEAYRSDHVAGMIKMPKKGGMLTGQSGYWAVWGAHPANAQDVKKAESASNPTGSAGNDDGGGMGGGAWAGIIAAAVVVLGGGGFLASKKKKPADDRE